MASIGNLVKLKKPVNNCEYGTIKGWNINKEKQGMGPIGSTPFNGAKINSTIIELKATPYFTNDYTGVKINLTSNDFTVIKDEYSEIQNWKKRTNKGESMKTNEDCVPLRLGSVIGIADGDKEEAVFKVIGFNGTGDDKEIIIQNTVTNQEITAKPSELIYTLIHESVVHQMAAFMKHVIGEALHDIEKYMDDEMIRYMNDNLNDPARKDKFLRAVKHYSDLAKRETDPIQALYYEYRMYLPEQQAKILAKEFYQREVRSGTWSDVGISAEGEEYSIIDSVKYGNSGSDKGMFASLTGATDHPGRQLEVQDFFAKLFASDLLDSQDRMVLVTYLLLGTGPGLRAKAGSNRQGIDLEMIMDNPPKELGIIQDQIKKLIKFGVDPDNITTEKILQGFKKDGGGNAPNIPGLVSTQRVSKAQKTIQAALKKLIGKDDLSEIRKYMVVEGKDDTAIVTNTIIDMIEGKSVSTGNLIKAIVYAVNININKKTRLSKSKIFNGSVKQIASTYLKMAKSKDPAQINKVQDMFMAPIVDKLDNRK